MDCYKFWMYMVYSLSFGISLALSSAGLSLPWFKSHNVTRINTCCRLSNTIKGFILQNNNFTNIPLISCTSNRYPCELNSDYKSQVQLNLEQDTSALSTLTFVKASPFLIILHAVVCFYKWLRLMCCMNKETSVLENVLLVVMIISTSISTAGVAVYATVYKNKIGFSSQDLYEGWKCTTAACAVGILANVIEVIVQIYHYVTRPPTHKPQPESQRKTTHIVTSDNWTSVKWDTEQHKVTM